MPRSSTIGISELKPGSVLAAPVHNEQLDRPLEKDTILDQQLINRLRAAGITEVEVAGQAEADASQQTHDPSAGTRQPLEPTSGSAESTEHCSRCGTLIALRPPAPSYHSSAWHCTTCGAVYFGSDDGSVERRGLYRVDPAVQNPFAPVVGHAIPPENVQRLVRSLAADEYKGPDRRGQTRYLVTVPVVALPLASDFRIDGDPMQMTTANVSLSGAALVHTRFVDAEYLAIDFTAAGLVTLQVVLKVLRVRSLGPAYEMSGEFISRVAQIPSGAAK